MTIHYSHESQSPKLNPNVHCGAHIRDPNQILTYTVELTIVFFFLVKHKTLMYLIPNEINVLRLKQLNHVKF